MITYYWTCPHCGANLDPGERCDCQDSMKKKKQAGRRHLANLQNTKNCVNNNVNYKEDKNKCQQQH